MTPLVRGESATPRSAIQPVQLGLGEKVDVCILFRRDGQTQANERIVLTCIMAPPARFRDGQSQISTIANFHNVGNIPPRKNVG